MVNLIGNFSRLDRKKVLVAGDLMLDTYTIGKARRISPEAPVAVIEVKTSEERPGGAGNTILNLISMGADVIALGRIGLDEAGKALLKCLVNEKADVQGIIEEKGFKTPVKNRIIADGQQIVRVDHEEIKALTEEAEETILLSLPSLLEGVQAIALSDYGKGFLSERLLKTLIREARKKNIFIIADPKGNDFSRYAHVNLIKPNQKEAFQAAHLDETHTLDQAAERIFAKTSADYLMVTRSEDGISLFQKDQKQQDFPVLAKQVKDVTGAGDTVLAMLTLAIANQLPLPIAIQFSNVAAGIAIEQFGCARVTLPQLAKRLLEIDSTNKVFDSEHIHALKSALADHPCTLISLPGSKPPSSELINALSAHKKSTGHSIVAAIHQEPCDPATIEMLSALLPIDFILLNTDQERARETFPLMNFWKSI